MKNNLLLKKKFIYPNTSDILWSQLVMTSDFTLYFKKRRL